jgi:hypothetical protein
LRICVLHDNLVPYKNWRKFSFMPKHFGHIGKIQMLKEFQAVQEFVCCLITLGRLERLNKIFFSCPQFWVLSHMKEIRLTRIRSEILVNTRRYLNHLKSRGHINLLIPP